MCSRCLPSPCESVSSYKDARRTRLGPPYCSQHDVTLMTSEGQSQIWGYEFDVSFGGQFSPPQALSRTSINQAGDCGSHHKGQRKQTQLRQPECPARQWLRQENAAPEAQRTAARLREGGGRETGLEDRAGHRSSSTRGLAETRPSWAGAPSQRMLLGATRPGWQRPWSGGLPGHCTRAGSVGP